MIKGIMWWICVILMVLLIFPGLPFVLTMTMEANVYKIVWTNPAGANTTFEKVDNFVEHTKKDAISFRDLSTGEYITIGGGMRKIYLVEKRTRWDDFKKEHGL